MGMKMWSGCFSLDNEEVKDVTADKARRIWEILLKIRDEEKGEHNDYEVVISESGLVRTGSEKRNSPLAI
jgi:hypothetical protein